jgi:hypothetical protein
VKSLLRNLILFVACASAARGVRSEGDLPEPSTFTKIAEGPVVTDRADSYGCAWGDFDNDDLLDLAVANGGFNGRQRPFVYRNLGNGSFAGITNGTLATELAGGIGVAWADYNNDGFLDLFVANVANTNFLYRNNGNSNRWLKVKCVGINSNRSAIGAKVRVNATIRGNTVWQLREITGGHGRGGQALVGHFGLGDAEVAKELRIEWPSGIVQELRDIPANQLLTILEPPRLKNAHAAGQPKMSIIGGKGLVFDLQSSMDLINWSRIQSQTNLTGQIEFADPSGSNLSQGFYRAVVRGNERKDQIGE